MRAPELTVSQEALAANNLDVQKAAEWLVQKGRSAKGKACLIFWVALVLFGRPTALLLMDV